jgi:hypothetical protein
MYCFKDFYTLEPSTHIKINFKITPTCFGPTGPKHIGVILKLILICVEGSKV